jgi:very-short-patch-repair endonuclease
MGSRTLIEIEGGIFLPGGGRHNRGGGYAKDAEKYLEAVLAGWTVIRLTAQQLEVDFIERIVAWINTPRGAGCRSNCDPPP